MENKILTQIDCRYLINEQGEVYSLFGSRGLRKKPNKINPQIDLRGYLRMAVFFDDNRRLDTGVHRLVASAFLGFDLFDRDKDIHHKDGNKQNNYYKNLEIVPHKGYFHNSSQNLRAREKRFFTQQEKEKLSNAEFSEWEEVYKEKLNA